MVNFIAKLRTDGFAIRMSVAGEDGRKTRIDGQRKG